MKLISLFFLFLPFNIVLAQEICGKWYSKDSTRIYLIYKNGDQFDAILERSSRKNDQNGVPILKDVIFRNKKRQLHGVIHSADQEIITKVKIRFEDMEGRILRLRVRRMFFMNFTIRWYKIEDSISLRFNVSSRDDLSSIDKSPIGKIAEAKVSCSRLDSLYVIFSGRGKGAIT